MIIYKSFFFESVYDFKAKFKLFNKKYFDNLLPNNLKISFINKPSVKYAGLAVGTEGITINRAYADGYTERENDSLLVHEMIHVYLFHLGLDDTYYKGRRVNLHQGEFNKKAKEIESKSGNILTLTGKTMKKHHTDFEGNSDEKIWILFYNEFDGDFLIKCDIVLGLKNKPSNNEIDKFILSKYKYYSILNRDTYFLFELDVDTLAIDKERAEYICKHTNIDQFKPYSMPSDVSKNVIRNMKQDKNNVLFLERIYVLEEDYKHLDIVYRDTKLKD